MLDYDELISFLKENMLGIYFENDPFAVSKGDRVVMLNIVSEILLNKLVKEFNQETNDDNS